MNPKYPMGRQDYFFTGIGVAAMTMVPFLALYAVVVSTMNDAPDVETFFEFWPLVVFLPSLPLILRRMKACQFPLHIFWCFIAVSFAIGYATDDGSQANGVINVLDILFSLYLLFAPNKVEPVTANPNLS